MRLISPIDHAREAEPLLRAGADELYGGYVPPEWQQRFGLLASLNQRTFSGAQIASLVELKEILHRCQQRQRDFALTLNTPYYTQQQLPLLLDYVTEVVAAGVRTLILADLGLLRILRRRFPQVQFHASTLAHLGNSAAIRFYQLQGVERVVLPRHLALAEIAQIAARCDLACDAFILIGKCPNTEGLCSFHHASENRIWPCEIEHCIEAVDPTDPVLDRAMAKQHSWSQTNRRNGCGLCALPALLESGISGLKLVGRGAPLPRKVKNLQLVAEFLGLARTHPEFSRYQQRARRAYRQHFGIGCNENVCYYPEFYPKR